MPDPILLLQMLLLLIVIGGVAGVLAGLLGVGGGIVLVPAFFYAFQTLGYGGAQLMQLCLATSLATIIVTSARSVHSHEKKAAVDWDILCGWAPGVVLGALVGVSLAATLSSAFLQALFGVLGVVVGAYLGLGRLSWRLGESMPIGIKRGVMSPVLGFMSVLMGIGGGSFGVPLMSLYNVPIHRAVATAAGFGVLISVPSVLGFLFLPLDPATRPPLTIGAVNLIAFLAVIAMTLVTAPVGVRIAHAMDPKPLKRIFAVFLTMLALNMLRKAMGW